MYVIYRKIDKEAGQLLVLSTSSMSHDRHMLLLLLCNKFVTRLWLLHNKSTHTHARAYRNAHINCT